MKTCRVLVLLAFLLCGCVGLVWADDEADIRKVVGRDIQTCMVEGNWAVADVGSLEKQVDEPVLLHRYKNEWRPVTITGGMTPLELMALGMPDITARNLGLAKVPDEVVQALHKAMKSAGLSHAAFNVVTASNAYYGYTANDGHRDGYQIWYYNGSWRKMFFIEGNVSQTKIDELFTKNGISRYFEFRILAGRGLS